MNLKSKWLNLITQANAKGIPVPMIRDPKTHKASVSLTLVFISFNIWLASIVGKATNYFQGIDSNSAFNMVVLCFGLYFGRRIDFINGKPEIGTNDELRSQPKD